MKKKEYFKFVLSSGYDAVALYEDAVAHINLHEEPCPFCGKIGCTNHGYYDRECKDFSDGEPLIRHFKMLRAKCKHCKRTHAVHLEIFEPFKRYSKAFWQEILAFIDKCSHSIKAACDSLYVASTTISWWRRKLPDSADEKKVNCSSENAQSESPDFAEGCSSSRG